MQLFLSTANGFYQEHAQTACHMSVQYIHIATTNTLDNTIGIICTNTASILCRNCSYRLATGDETKIVNT